MEIRIKLPEALVARAASSGLEPSVLVERLLARIADLEKINSEREKLRQELAADWDHLQATGLHLDEEDVDAWLTSLERGQNTDLPELHI